MGVVRRVVGRVGEISVVGVPGHGSLGGKRASSTAGVLYRRTYGLVTFVH